MSSNAERDIFVHISTPASFNNNLPTRHNSHASTDTAGRQRGRVEGGDGPPDQLENHAVFTCGYCKLSDGQSGSGRLEGGKNGRS